MWESHFGLRHLPFRATADQSSYYPATSHEQAIARLVEALQADEGAVLLTGEAGTGKTLVCHQVLERLGPDVCSACLTNTHFADRASLLQAVLYDLGLPHEGRSEQELRLALTDFLLKNYSEGRRTLLVVDEAQHLSADLLEEIRLWGNLEGQGRQALQVVLAAQPGLCALLRTPELTAFRRRLGVHVRLEPLPVSEAADYVWHHLRSAGGQPERIASEEAIDLLVRGSGGVPRVLNRVCREALRLAGAADAKIDAEIALEALANAEPVGDLAEPDPAATPLPSGAAEAPSPIEVHANVNPLITSARVHRKSA